MSCGVGVAITWQNFCTWQCLLARTQHEALCNQIILRHFCIKSQFHPLKRFRCLHLVTDFSISVNCGICVFCSREALCGGVSLRQSITNLNHWRTLARNTSLKKKEIEQNPNKSHSLWTTHAYRIYNLEMEQGGMPWSACCTPFCASAFDPDIASWFGEKKKSPNQEFSLCFGLLDPNHLFQSHAHCFASVALRSSTASPVRSYSVLPSRTSAMSSSVAQWCPTKYALCLMRHDKSIHKLWKIIDLIYCQLGNRVENIQVHLGVSKNRGTVPPNNKF